MKFRTGLATLAVVLASVLVGIVATSSTEASHSTPLPSSIDGSVDWYTQEFTINAQGQRGIRVKVRPNASTYFTNTYDVALVLNGQTLASKQVTVGPNTRSSGVAATFYEYPHHRDTRYEIRVEKTGFTAIPNVIGSSPFPSATLDFEQVVQVNVLGPSQIMLNRYPMFDIAAFLSMNVDYTYSVALTTGCNAGTTSGQGSEVVLYVDGEYYGSAFPYPFEAHELEHFSDGVDCEDRHTAMFPNARLLDAGLAPTIYATSTLEFVTCLYGNDNPKCREIPLESLEGLPFPVITETCTDEHSWETVEDFEFFCEPHIIVAYTDVNGYESQVAPGPQPSKRIGQLVDVSHSDEFINKIDVSTSFPSGGADNVTLFMDVFDGYDLLGTASIDLTEEGGNVDRWLTFSFNEVLDIDDVPSIRIEIYSDEFSYNLPSIKYDSEGTLSGNMYKTDSRGTTALYGFDMHFRIHGVTWF